MNRTQRIAILQRHTDRLTRRINTLQQRSTQLASWRLLALFGGGALTLFLALTPYSIAFGAALVLSLISFVVFVALHRRVEDSVMQLRLWRQLKRQHQARLEIDWDHLPEMREVDAPHPLEVDLDLAQVHRLLNTAITDNGQERLREWLLPLQPDLQASQQRQQLVSELALHPTFRDKLTLYSRLSTERRRKGFDTTLLRDWLSKTAPTNKVDRSLAIVAALAGLNVVLFGLFALGLLSQQVVGGAWAVYVVAYLSRIGLMNELNADMQSMNDLLSRLQAVMQHLERTPYKRMPAVAGLIAPLLEARPSQHIRRMNHTLAATSLRGNPILWATLNAIMPWDLFFLRRLNLQKSDLAEALPAWLDIWYELEALNSLATFAQHHDDAHMPELHQDKSAPVLSAAKIGHPLITPDQRINNDFTFNEKGEIVILTGSNMSGKSSFLRTLGVNLALAYAGAPVIAEQMSAQPVRVFSSIRVTDSLDDGISYFYAEVKRLRELLSALTKRHPQPLFFLIDEIFRGTNNRERLVGSQSYINALVGQNGVGLIATHDLELTQIAEGNPLVRNMHFRETIEEGEMHFSYRLLDGPSPTTNALHIMALEGLPVAWPDDLKEADNPETRLQADDNRSESR